MSSKKKKKKVWLWLIVTTKRQLKLSLLGTIHLLLQQMYLYFKYLMHIGS